MADLSDGANWFETDASNNKGPPNGWPEGMMPSTVNDTARADKGALKRFWDKINPVQGIAQSGDGHWLFQTSNTAYPTTYVPGEIYAFKAGSDGSGNDQFAVNNLGLKPIYVVRTDANIVPTVQYDIMAGHCPYLIYDPGLNSGSGGFILLNPWLPISNSSSGGVQTATVFGNFAVSGLFQSNYNGSGSGGVAIYATAGGLRSDAGGTALYLPNGDISCQNIVTAGSSAGGPGSNVAILCNTGAVQASKSGTAFYAPNGDVVCQNITASVQGFKPGGGSWAAISDIRLKRDINDYEIGLAAILALRPVTYSFNGKGGMVHDGKRYVGLVADEVLPVMPEMVGTISALLDPDDAAPSEIKTLDTTALIFALVNCCQELAARVAKLEADVRD
jgi:hypothetical protein